MPKVDASSAGQQEIVEALMKEIGGMSLQEMVSKAVAEGARWGARESLRSLGQQLLNGNPGDAGALPSALATVVAAKALGPRTSHAIELAIPRVAAGGDVGANVPGAASGTKRAECPVPRCKEPGVRQYHNFCRKHYNSLSEAEIKGYRAKQVVARKPPPRQLVKCPVPDCRNTGIRPLQNFCQEHYNGLPQGKRLELRNQQLSAHRKKKRDERKAAQAG